MTVYFYNSRQHDDFFQILIIVFCKVFLATDIFVSNIKVFIGLVQSLVYFPIQFDVIQYNAASVGEALLGQQKLNGDDSAS